MTAVAFADQHGIEALSMRKLGQELGASAMSAYYYFANKEQLLDGMVDVVFAEIEPPSPELEWKTAMRARAVSTRETLNRHRWAIGHMEGRTDHGRANLRLHDAVLGCLRAAGFSPAATVHAYSVQDAYIYGFVLQETDMSPGDRGRLRSRGAAADGRLRGDARGLPPPRRGRRRPCREGRL